jgi:hypothetical protein
VTNLTHPTRKKTIAAKIGAKRTADIGKPAAGVAFRQHIGEKVTGRPVALLRDPVLVRTIAASASSAV